MECLICGKKFKRITASHLRTHDLTCEDYKEKFPTAFFIGEEERKEISDRVYKQHETMDKDPNSNFGFKKGHKINEGKIPWCKGLTKETDSRVAEISKKLTGRELSLEQRRMISERQKRLYKEDPYRSSGPKNSMYGKKLSEEHRKKLHDARYNYNKKMNGPESRVYDVIKNRNFIYTGDRSYWLDFKNGHHKNPDFINETNQIAVEVYGDYWHRNDDPQDLIDLYNEIGWDCVVIWEHDANNYYDLDMLDQALGTWENEEFTYEDFDGKWLL